MQRSPLQSDSGSARARLAWQQGETFYLSVASRGTAEITAGRDTAADISLPHESVSWHHARLTPAPPNATHNASHGWIVTDLGATNGTFINGVALGAHQSAPLRAGDVLGLGACELHCVEPATQAGEQSSHAPGATRFFEAPRASSWSIGRGPQCEITLDHPSVSWQHARLTRRGAGWLLEDLGSANGTWVSGVRVESAEIRESDRIEIGAVRLCFSDKGVEIADSQSAGALEARGLWKQTRAGATLLRDVSLTIKPGELVAIAGASGAGKSTLLKALNGSQPASRGAVALGGLDFYAHREFFALTTGYVPQDDIVHTDLTVAAALRYAAKLRLPADTTETEIAVLVARTLHELEIAARSDHPIRSLSGGERKRVNIAVELLTRPAVLFLDEPTTGLDAGLERRVTALLRRLADEGCSVVTVTHAAATLDSYDKIAFLARGGRLLFFGPPREALRFFGARDFAGIYEILDDESRHPAPQPSAPSAAVAPPHRGTIRPVSRHAAWAQTATLLSRYGAVVRADARNLLLWMGQAPLVAFLLAMLFDAGIFAATQNRDGDGDWPLHGAPRLLFLMAFSLMCFGLCNAAREIVKERAIYQRERGVALRIGPYLCSKVALLGAIALIQTLVTFAIVSAKVPFHLSAADTLTAISLLFLVTLNAITLGLLVSALASSPDQAITLVAALLLIQVLFSGLVPLQKLPEWLRPFASLCAVRWSYGGLCGLTDLAARWQNLGLGAWADDVMKTQARHAIQMLCLLALGSFGATWLTLEWKSRAR